MKNRVLIPLIVAVVFLLLASSAYAFAYYTLVQSTASVTSLNQAIEEKTILVQRAASSQAALSSLSADEATVGQYFVGKQDVVPFLETIQSTGKPLGALVDVLSVSDEKVQGHPRIRVLLSVQGSFDAVMRTLGAIEYGPYDGAITNLTLDSAKGDPKLGTVWTAATTLSVGSRSATTTPIKKP